MRFLLRLIVKNPGKLIIILITALSFYFAGKFDYETSTANVAKVDTVKIGNSYRYLYIIPSGGSFEVKTFLEPQKLTNNQLSWLEYNGFNVLMWVIFVASIIVYIFAALENRWEISETREEALYSKIVCIEEDGKYHYVLNNKLLSTIDAKPNNARIDKYSFSQSIRNYIENKNILPEFYSKSDKRNKKLDNIGI